MKKNSLAAAIAPKKSGNAFDGMSDVLGVGFGDIMNTSGITLSMLKLADITVSPQIRLEMEDESNSMQELAASIDQDGVFQTVLVRPTPNGPRPYELVAGGRRYFGSEMAGKDEIPCLIKEMTDAKAADIQLQENIQRKNLTQIEMAKKLKADLAAHNGDMEALMAQHKKSRSFLSKVLSLTSLDTQATRVIKEQISADLEVIGMVKTVEKINPAAANAMVTELKDTRGKVDARKVAEKHKDAVKPPSKAKVQKQGEKATAKDEANKEPGTATVHNFAEAKSAVKAPSPEWPFPGGDDDKSEEHASGTGPALSPSCLEDGYDLIFKKGLAPKAFMESLAKQDRSDVQDWLQSFYDAGRNRDNMALGLIQGLRNGTFTTEGSGAFAMLAFVQGGDAQVQKFNVLNVLGLAKA
jgi:ParB family chromosome partitioning protein